MAGESYQAAKCNIWSIKSCNCDNKTTNAHGARDFHTLIPNLGLASLLYLQPKCRQDYAYAVSLHCSKPHSSPCMHTLSSAGETTRQPCNQPYLMQTSLWHVSFPVMKVRFICLRRGAAALTYGLVLMLQQDALNEMLRMRPWAARLHLNTQAHSYEEQNE